MSVKKDFDLAFKFENIRIFLANSDRSSLKAFSSMIEQIPGFEIICTATDGKACLEKSASNPFDILVTDFNLPKISGVKLAEHFSIEDPGVATVILTEQSNLGFFRSAMLAGASDFLITPLTSEELEYSLKRVRSIQLERKKRMGALIEESTKYEHKQARRSGKVITFLSGKGGSGKSFIAAVVTGLIAQNNPDQKIGLIDFDIQFGDLEIMYDIKAGSNWLDLLPITGELNTEAIIQTATKIPKFKQLDLFASPNRVEKYDIVYPEFIQNFFETIKHNYDLIFVNTGPGFDHLHITLIEQSEKLVLLTSPDIADSTAFVQLNNYLKKMEIKPDDMLYVLNRFVLGQSPAVTKLEEMSGIEFASVIPLENEIIPNSINIGKACDCLNNKRLNLCFELLARKITESVGLPSGNPDRCR